MRNELGQFTGDKYKKINGVWHRTQCLDCGKWLRNVTAKHCKRCDSARKAGKDPYYVPNGTTYSNLHKWVYKKLGKAKECWFCNENRTDMKYEWANKSGYYEKDVNDWLRLCIKCHRRYDSQRRKLC